MKWSYGRIRIEKSGHEKQRKRQNGGNMEEKPLAAEDAVEPRP